MSKEEREGEKRVIMLETGEENMVRGGLSVKERRGYGGRDKGGGERKVALGRRSKVRSGQTRKGMGEEAAEMGRKKER